jgi:hypothetical protein
MTGPSFPASSISITSFLSIKTSCFFWISPVWDVCDNYSSGLHRIIVIEITIICSFFIIAKNFRK